MSGRVFISAELHALSNQTDQEASDDARRDAARARQSRQDSAQHVLARHIQDCDEILEELHRNARGQAEDQARQERAAPLAAGYHAKNCARDVHALLQGNVARRQEHGLLDISALHEGAVSPGEICQTGICREEPDDAESLSDGARCEGRHGPADIAEAQVGAGRQQNVAIGDNQYLATERDLRADAN